jgi:hypothetical protein
MPDFAFSLSLTFNDMNIGATPGLAIAYIIALTVGDDLGKKERGVAGFFLPLRSRKEDVPFVWYLF